MAIDWQTFVSFFFLSFLQNDDMISYLPLSHVAAQMLDVYAPLQCGLTVHFAQPDALKGSLSQTLKVR